MLKEKTYILLSSIFFAIAGLLHLLRLINSWDARVSNLEIPLWISGVIVLLTGYFVFSAYKIYKK